MTWKAVKEGAGRNSCNDVEGSEGGDWTEQERGVKREEVTDFSTSFTHIATARALTNCRGWLITADDFQAAAADSPAASRWLQDAAWRYIHDMQENHVHMQRRGRMPRAHAPEVLDTGAMQVTSSPQSVHRTSIYELVNNALS